MVCSNPDCPTSEELFLSLDAGVRRLKDLADDLNWFIYNGSTFCPGCRVKVEEFLNRDYTKQGEKS
jgi:hypothetical protein